MSSIIRQIVFFYILPLYIDIFYSFLLFCVSGNGSFLLGRTDIRNPEKELSNAEKCLTTKDVKKAIKRLLSQFDLMFQGELLKDEDKIILNNFIQIGLKTIQDLKRKEKIEKDADIENSDK